MVGPDAISADANNNRIPTQLLGDFINIITIPINIETIPHIIKPIKTLIDFCIFCILLVVQV
jgi:hypothetical protein